VVAVGVVVPHAAKIAPSALVVSPSATPRRIKSRRDNCPLRAAAMSWSKAECCCVDMNSGPPSLRPTRQSMPRIAVPNAGTHRCVRCEHTRTATHDNTPRGV
jgi:hypothetical protein